MAQQVKVEISIEGERISPFASISITQEIHHHHSFEIVLPVDAFETTSLDALQKSKSMIGKRVSIQFGPNIFKERYSDNNQFIGLVTYIGVSRTGNGEKELVIQGSSPTILMEGHGQFRTFTNKSLQGLAEAMLENVPQSLETQLQPMFSGTIPYVVQFNESNYNFLQRMAMRYGEWCFYDGTKLIFGKLSKDKTIDLPFGEDLFNLDFSMRLLPVNGSAIAYNYIENKVYESKASGVSINDLDDFGKFALDQSGKVFAQEPVLFPADVIQKQQELKEVITQQKSSIARELITATGDSDNPYLNAGTIVNITGESVKEDDYGKFIITSITHIISEDYSYKNYFSAIPAENQSSPSPDIQEPVAESQLAVVVDNQDPEGLGRVKAKFFWQKNGETTAWMRVVQPMAGNGKNAVHGAYFIPEIDDEVMVGFEGHNPDRPYVIGSIYHKNVAPMDWKDNENNIKAFRTKSGNQIYFIDKDGKEEIKILNKDVDGPTNIISLLMEGDGIIRVETKGDLIFKAKNINMTATEEIKIESGKTTAIKAMEVKVDADKAVDMKSQKLNIENTTTSLKASAKLDIEGGQSAIKASILKIDGGANASVKAAIIQLN